MAKESIGSMRQAVGRGGAFSSNKVSTAKTRASDQLEEDAQVMEERLVQLRLKMLEDKQRLEKELPAKFGGSRWRSAQENIGSVSRYAKDLEGRMVKSQPKKSRDPENGVKATKPRMKTKTNKGEEDDSLPIVPSLATVKKWTTKHVLEWLTSIGMDEFHSAFEFHQVTGIILLAMQPEEFTQIGISRLSARNTLWNELERLKDAAKNAQRRGLQEATEVIDPKIRDIAPVPEVSALRNGGSIHWSQVNPLRDPSVPPSQPELPVNLADGEFDEDGSHASFMKALLDWRTGDDNGEDRDNTLWFNPSGTSNNDTNSPVREGGALLNGEYDEGKEQEAFRRAVMAWRKSGAPDAEAESRPSTAEIERIEQSCDTGQRKSCWQCYRVVRIDLLTRDKESQRDFCSTTCQVAFGQEHARLYSRKQDS